MAPGPISSPAPAKTSTTSASKTGSDTPVAQSSTIAPGTPTLSPGLIRYNPAPAISPGLPTLSPDASLVSAPSIVVAACEASFFETLIAMNSENPVQCTSEEIVAIQEVLDTTYNEAVITLDQSPVEVIITATLCLDTVAANQRSLESSRHRLLAPKVYAYRWKGP